MARAELFLLAQASLEARSARLRMARAELFPLAQASFEARSARLRMARAELLHFYFNIPVCCIDKSQI